MQLKYKFGLDGLMTDIWFDGLDESEHITSVSQAMTKLRVRNPAVVFTEEAKAGLFDEVSDEEYYAMLSSIECIAMLWRYKGDKPADKSTQREVNVLTLLANAIHLLTQQNIQLKKLMDTCDGPDFEDGPTWDEETLAEIEEAMAEEAAMAVLEREWELEQAGEEMELDDFGNPIIRDKNGNVIPPRIAQAKLPDIDDTPFDFADPPEDNDISEDCDVNSNNRPNNG